MFDLSNFLHILIILPDSLQICLFNIIIYIYIYIYIYIERERERDRERDRERERERESAVCISYNINTPEKNMNPTILSPAIGKYSLMLFFNTTYIMVWNTRIESLKLVSKLFYFIITMFQSSSYKHFWTQFERFWDLE